MNSSIFPGKHFKGILGGVLAAFLLSSALTGCIVRPQPQASQDQDNAGTYTQESWREMIPEDCMAYFDGCNTCRRNPQNGIAACTRKACFAYAKPYCMDDAASPTDVADDGYRVVPYVCEGGNRFSVSYGDYRSGDQRMRLQPDQVVLSDRQRHTAYLMSRVVSASGEKYSDGTLTLFGKGDEALVDENGERLCANCKRE